MKYDEIDRVAELILQLQNHQLLEGVSRIPTGDDLRREIVRIDQDINLPVPNNFGTFTVIAIDKSRETDDRKSEIIGYVIYSNYFSIMAGNIFWMNSFFLEAEYRNVGLGKRMMQFIFQHGRCLGIKRIHIPYKKNNMIGRKFYSKFGSSPVGDEYRIRKVTID